LRIPPFLSGYKVAILPLLKKDGLPEKARAMINHLKTEYMCLYEEKDSIGKRYRRMDAIGVPFCITIDHQTLEDNTVTLRDRDTMIQERVTLAQIEKILEERVSLKSQLLKLQGE
jgi:glycyl-tRNA synthetase